MNNLINVTRFIIGLSILSYGAYTDLKTREASNKLWLLMGIMGAVLLTVERPDAAETLTSIAISFPLALLLYIFGMGGADVKAMWGIALLSPLPPSFYSLPLSPSPIFIFPLTVLINSLFVIIPLPLAFLIYNALKGDVEFPQCLFGYKMDANKAKNSFVWSMEREDGRKGIMPVKNFDFDSAGNKRLWVTPQMPFLVFITVGFIISFIFGDILFSLLSLLQ